MRSVVLGLCSLPLVVAAADARAAKPVVDPANYTVTFSSYALDPQRCETTVCWDVTQRGDQSSISHFGFELGACAGVRAAITEGEHTWTFGPDDLVERPDGSCDGLMEVKFDGEQGGGFDGAGTKNLCVTYAGLLPLSQEANTVFNVKASNVCLPPIMVQGVDCAGSAGCEQNGCAGQWSCEGGAGTCDVYGGNACGGCGVLAGVPGDSCVKDACTSGQLVCHGGGLVCDDAVARDCSTGDPCLDGRCDPQSGCYAVPTTAPCDDGDACTERDVCAGGECQSGAAVTCDDGQACTHDRCDVELGCVAVADDALSCDDGDACDGAEVCRGGACVEGADLDCDDGDPCTGDACDPEQGCTWEPTTASCSDGDPCNGDEVCGGGSCQPGTPPCQALCAPDGRCYACDDDDDCEDGLACSEDVCVDGQCTHDNEDCEGCPEGTDVDLGVALDFNAFVCGDYVGLRDSLGRLAVRGTMQASGFSVGIDDAGGVALVVGGAALTLTNGTVNGGVRHAANTNVALTSVDVQGDVAVGAPVDFDAVCNRVEAASQSLSVAVVTGQTVVHAWGGIELVGQDATLNVFALDSADIDAAVSLVVQVPAGSTTLVNVSGGPVAFSGFEIAQAGLDPERVLWNFDSSVSAIDIHGFAFQGTLLAPFADVTFNSGHINGTLIADDVSGDGELHWRDFDGELACPPEPSDDDAGDDEPPPAASCGALATFQITNSWQGGFQAAVRFTNLTTQPIDGWTLGWTFDAAAQANNVWGVGSWSQSGATVTATNPSWASVVWPNQTVEVGLTGSGAPGGAHGFTLNGAPCGGQRLD